MTSFRRAVYCTRPLQAGDRLRREDLVVLRPNHGVDARDFEDVVGRQVACDTPAFGALRLAAGGDVPADEVATAATAAEVAEVAAAPWPVAQTAPQLYLQLLAAGYRGHDLERVRQLFVR